MIKTFCDKKDCGKQIEGKDRFSLQIFNYDHKVKRYDICEICLKEIKKLLK